MIFIFWVGVILACVSLFNCVGSKGSAGHEFAWVFGVIAGCAIVAFSKGIIHL